MMRRFCAILLLIVMYTANALAGSNTVFDYAFLEDEHLISVNWDGRNLYGLFSDGSIWRYEENEEPVRYCETENVDFLAADNGIIYGFDIEGERACVIDESGYVWNDIELDFDSLYTSDEEYPNRISSAFIKDDLLFLVVQQEEYADEEYELYIIDLTDGLSVTTDLPGLRAACLGPENSLLCLRFEDDEYWLSLYEVEDDFFDDITFVEIPLGNEDVGGLAYDADTDSVFISAYGKIWQKQGDSVFRPFSPVDTDFLENGAQAWVLSDGSYALMNGRVQICHEGLQPRQLRISGYISMEQEQLFRSMHPDIELVFIDRVSAEDLTARLNTSDSSIDVFILKADYTFTAMKEKGYTAQLESPTLTSLSTSLDSAISDVVCNETDAVLAWPYNLRIWTHNINKGYWHLFWPDRPLPETYDELLDAWIDFETNIAEEYPGVGFIGTPFDYAQQVYNLVSEFVMQHGSEDLPDMHDPALRSALEKLGLIRDIRMRKQRSISKNETDGQIEVDSETGPGFVYWRTLASPLSDEQRTAFRLEEDYMYGLPKGETEMHAIAFGIEDNALTSVYMDVLVLNPFSENMDDALLFIECMAQKEADPQTWYAIFPNDNAPLEDPAYAARYEQYSQSKHDLESAMQEAELSGDALDINMQYQLQYYSNWLENEAERWIVSQEALDTYRAQVREHPLDPHAESPYTGETGSAAHEIVMEACQQYANDQISIDMFLETISSRMKMIYWENQ